MNYHLSGTIIIKNMQAMAALQALADGDGKGSFMSGMLCKGRAGLMGDIIRSAFIETVMRLGPLACDIGMDESGEGDMSVELVTPSDFSATRHIAVRRTLEQTVAVTALALWCRGSASATADGKAERMATIYAERVAEWQKMLEKALEPTVSATLRSRGA